MVSLAGCAAKLEGIVIDRDTQKPVEGVKVKVKDAQGRSLLDRTKTTGEDGHFKIDKLDKKSKYKLIFDAQSYMPSPEEVYNLKELNKDEARNLKIKLEAVPGIWGIVLDIKTNEPIEKVNVMPRLDEQGNLSDALAVPQFTDKQGRFGIAHLKPGRYRLFINHEKYKAVYYPKEGTHELQRGASWRDITIPLEPEEEPPPPGQGTSIEGNVRDIENKPASGLEVKLYSENGQFIRQTTTDSEGKFNIEPLEPGKYRLCIEYNYKENGETKSYVQYKPEKDSPAYELRKGKTLNNIELRLPFKVKSGGKPDGGEVTPKS